MPEHLLDLILIDLYDKSHHLAGVQHELSDSLQTVSSVVWASCYAQATCTHHAMLSGGVVKALTKPV